MSLRHVNALTSTACNSESLGLHTFLPLFVLELCFLRDVSISLLLKCGTALNVKTGRGGNGGVWQLLRSVTTTKGLPHFHRCLHKYNRLAIIRLSPGFSMCEPEQGSATYAVECTNITSFVSLVSCDAMQSREHWIRKCVCSVYRLCIVHNCEQNVLQFGMQKLQTACFAILHTSLASDTTDAGLLQQ